MVELQLIYYFGGEGGRGRGWGAASEYAVWGILV